MASNPSDAVVIWTSHSERAVARTQEDSRPESGRWALILAALLSPSPGRTLDQLYTTLGNVLETHANRAAHSLGLGPDAVARKIKSYFGSGDERVRRLSLLRTATPPKLEKPCSKLLKYTLPTEAPGTQREAFKDIVDLVTLFPGLRVRLLRAKYMAGAKSTEAITALWDRPLRQPDQEWIFWKAFAATSLSDTAASIIMEGSNVCGLTACEDGKLSVIERLLAEHDACGASEFSRALCIRYLGGILDLPGYWANMGNIHSHVAKKLCCRMIQVLKDIGIDILTLGPIDESESPFDYAGVDFLGTTLLTGLSTWISKLDPKDWALQPWFENFAGLVRLLRSPRASEFLPNSSGYANHAFENILPTSYHGLELSILVDSETTLDNQNTCYHDHAATPDSEHDSTSDVHCNTREQADTQSVDSVSNDDSDAQGQDSDIDFVEPQSATPKENTLSIIEDEINPELGNVEIHRSRMVEGGPNSTSYLSVEALHIEAKKRQHILHQRRMNFGKNHADTLQAMENLAWIKYELGEFNSSRHLRILILEKWRALRGDNDPYTLHVMRALAATYHQLGQFTKAEELRVSALEKRGGLDCLDTLPGMALACEQSGRDTNPEEIEVVVEKTQLELMGGESDQSNEATVLGVLAVDKQMKFLDDNHPDTLWPMAGLAARYHELVQLKNAEELKVQVLEKEGETQGDYHGAALRIIANLAWTYHQLGKLKTAEELGGLALDKQKKLLGEHHPDTLQTMGNLALTYLQLGQLSTAERLWATVLEGQSKFPWEDHGMTVRITGNLASTYLQLGRLRTAQKLGVVAVEERRKFLGNNHPDTLWSMSSLAFTYTHLGELEAAEKLYVAVLKKRRMLLGGDHPLTRWTMFNLATTYRRLDKQQEADELEIIFGHQEL